MPLRPQLAPFIRLAAVAAIVAGAAAWAHPRPAAARPMSEAQVCHGGVYTLTVYQRPAR